MRLSDFMHFILFNPLNLLMKKVFSFYTQANPEGVKSFAQLNWQPWNTSFWSPGLADGILYSRLSKKETSRCTTPEYTKE